MRSDKQQMAGSSPELMTDPFEEAQGVAYREAIVTFIDILGFQRLVETKSENEVAGAIARLQQSAHPVPIGSKSKPSVRKIRPSRVHAFSDCVVRVRPAEGVDELGSTFARELADLASIQASLAGAGVFVRGGITIDQIHSSDTVVFGPGLIRAYKLENELAHVPRIVVDPAAVQKFRGRAIPKTRMRSEIAAMRKSIRQAEDGLWFVDYLRAGAASLGEDSAVREYLKEHRNRVTEAAATVGLTSAVLPKYLWAAKYHNASCARILGERSIPGITISKTQMPSFERLRLPVLLSR